MFHSPFLASWSPASATVSLLPPEGEATVRTFVLLNSICNVISKKFDSKKMDQVRGIISGKGSLTCRFAILRSSLEEAGLSLHASDPDPAMTPSSFVGQQHEFSHIVCLSSNTCACRMRKIEMLLFSQRASLNNVFYVFTSITLSGHVVLWSRPSTSLSRSLAIRHCVVQSKLSPLFYLRPWKCSVRLAKSDLVTSYKKQRLAIKDVSSAPSPA